MKYARLNLLIINADLPIFPGRGMHEYLNTVQLTKLAQEIGLVSAVHTPEQENGLTTLENYGIDLYVWKNPLRDDHQRSKQLQHSKNYFREIIKLTNNLLRTRLSRPADTIIQDFAFRNFAPYLLQALENRKWAGLVVIQSSGARWLDYLPEFPVSVLVFHDVRSLMYERRASIEKNILLRLCYLFETWRYKRFEREFSQKYDLCITVSSTDEEYALRYLCPNHLVTIPIPIDGDYFRPTDNISEVVGRIVFTGIMNHPPNVDAACYFAKVVLPKIQQQYPEVEFWIVGHDPSPNVQALASLPGVKVTGYVPDIRPYIGEAEIVVVPLRYGAGMRNKILEAWGMEKCIISTTIGAEGLNYQHEVNIIIADDTEQMIRQILRVLSDKNLKERIKKGGRDIILTEHNPVTIAQKYYQSIVEVYQQKQAREKSKCTVIDLRWLKPGLPGGIERLARSFIQELIRLDGQNEYIVYGSSAIKFDFDFRYHPNFRFEESTGPKVIARKIWKKGVSGLHHALKIPYWRSPEVNQLLDLRNLGASVAYSIPGYIHPQLYPLSNVLVVPDIQHEYFPEFFSPNQLEERRRLYAASLRHADHICAISEFTRQTLIERLNIDPDKITTTLLAADPIYRPGNNANRDASKIIKKYNFLDKKYLFFPANTWPHKNHITLFRALKILQEEYGFSPLLVCTGSAKEAQGNLLDFIRTHKMYDQIRFLGYVPLEDMPALYSHATATVFPSLFEGFGMPVLEAMWSKCPVVASNTTSIPEVAGDAAVLVDPKSPEMIADGIYQVMTDIDLRQRLISLGSRQAEKFSWQAFAVKTVQLLNKVWQER